MNIEKTMANLELELAALKSAYEQVGFTMPIFTKQIDFTATPNHIREYVEGYAGSENEYDEPGNILVTFDTATGSNTLASLEVIKHTAEENGMEYAMFINRIMYNGGARWLILQSQLQGEYTFIVRSTVDGTLRAKMAWQ